MLGYLSSCFLLQHIIIISKLLFQKASNAKLFHYCDSLMLTNALNIALNLLLSYGLTGDRHNPEKVTDLTRIHGMTQHGFNAELQ